MDRPIKIAYINGGLMDRGGISSMIIDYWDHMDHSKIHATFVGHGIGHGVREQEIIKKGGEVFNIIPKSMDYRQNVMGLKKIFQEGNYDIVHAHADAGNAHILKIAKECHVPIRISHSHNTNYTVNSKKQIFLNNILKKFIPMYATNLWACSTPAGKWLYGNMKFEIVHNAIDTEKYIYSEKKREEIRSKYNIFDSVLIGSVGKLEQRKNYGFLISCFENVIKENNNYRLMIIGDGEQKERLKKIVKGKRLEGYVIFTGEVDNTHDYYSAFDMMAMPSLFEGLPISAIEAQCNGLQCFFSDKITREVDLGKTNVFIDNTREDLWISQFLHYKTNDRFCNEGRNRVIRMGYDIVYEAKKLEHKYTELCGMVKSQEKKNEKFSCCCCI